MPSSGKTIQLNHNCPVEDLKYALIKIIPDTELRAIPNTQAERDNPSNIHIREGAKYSDVKNSSSYASNPVLLGKIST